jgi:hypothetical protein
MYEIKSYSVPSLDENTLVPVNQQTWYGYARNASPLLLGVSALNYQTYWNANLTLVNYIAYFTLGTGKTSFQIDYGLDGTFTFAASSLDTYETNILLGSVNAVQAPYDYAVTFSFETARGHSLALIVTSASTGGNILVIRTRTDPERHYDHHHVLHDTSRHAHGHGYGHGHGHGHYSAH